ncbi:lipopolysaccharide biosynthesis protein [Collinsella tanakaei]|uniref:lipopolysaccharide biosynthesis protein n=1 Tax=Collinsella tanakaei TaxID=626935 RepID=UPI0019595C15|nr:oligosaccharide flippase family protein [Collinsella tanakaei]
MNKKKVGREAKSAVAFTFASVFSRGLAVVSMPIFTRIMSTAEIGVVSLYNSWFSMISVVATLALSSGGYSLAMKEFADERDKYESSVLSLTSLMALLLAGIYFAAPDFWSSFTGLPPHLMGLMLVGFLVSPAWDFWTLRQRYEYKYRLASLLTVIEAVAATALSVAVVLKLGSMGSDSIAEGRLFGNYSVVYGFCTVAWLVTMARGRTFFDARYWRYSLSLSLPLIGYSIASQVLGVSDRVLIANMVGQSEAGIYGTLYSASTISTFVWTAINSSFIPYLYQHIEEEGHQGIRRTSLQLLMGFGAVSVVISWLGPEIIRVLATEEYMIALDIMPPIAAGVFLTSVSNMYSNVLVYHHRTKYIMFSAVAAAVVNIVLNLTLIPVFGYKVAAWVTLVGYVALVLPQYLWAQRAAAEEGRKTPVYNNRLIFVVSLVVICLIMLGLVFYQLATIRYLACALLVIVGIVAAAKIYRGGKNVEKAGRGTR